MTKTKKDHHITALRGQNNLNRLAAKKKPQFTDGELGFYEAKAPAQNAEAVIAAYLEAQEEAHAKALTAAKPGDLIEGHGVFIGTWEAKDRSGVRLGLIFAVYAAPEDLTDEEGKRGVLTYDDTIKRISALKDWHGFDGANYGTDTDLFMALQDDSYAGGWVMPPGQLLMGKDTDGRLVHTDNLFNHRNSGALRDTFTTVATPGIFDSAPDSYWSSTVSPHNESLAVSARFSGLVNSFDSKNNQRRLACRPIRLERTPKKKSYPRMDTLTVLGG